MFVHPTSPTLNSRTILEMNSPDTGVIVQTQQRTHHFFSVYLSFPPSLKTEHIQYCNCEWVKKACEKFRMMVDAIKNTRDLESALINKLLSSPMPYSSLRYPTPLTFAQSTILFLFFFVCPATLNCKKKKGENRRFLQLHADNNNNKTKKKISASFLLSMPYCFYLKVTTTVRKDPLFFRRLCSIMIYATSQCACCAQIAKKNVGQKNSMNKKNLTTEKNKEMDKTSKSNKGGWKACRSKNKECSDD